MAIPKIALIPSGVKAGKLYSVLPTNGDGDFTTTRASVATRVNENGLIEEVAANVPRLDYSDGTCPSLLLEGTATNLITYSEDFSNSGWQKVDCSITSNSAISPDGTLNADKYTSNGIDPYLQYYASSTSITNSLSVWVKGVGSTIGKSCRIFAVRDAYAETTNEFFTLTSEWQRIEATLTFSVAPTSTVGFRLDAPNDAVIGDEVLVYGAQLEQNSYATSYIKTVGTAQTRVADTASGSGNSTVINSSEGVLYFEGSALESTVSGDRHIILNGDSTNYINLYYNTVGNLIIKYNVGGGSTFLGYAVANQTTTLKIAVVWKINRFELWVNGVNVSSDYTEPIFATQILNELKFSDGNNGSHFYGKTKSLQVYTTALSDAELTTLTTI